MKAPFRISPKARLAGISLIRSLGIIVLVLAILMIVIGLFLPAKVGPIESSPNKVTAHNDETQIISAVNAYFTEYHKYPVDPSKAHGTVVFSADNNLLFDALRKVDGAQSDNPLNPRGVFFLVIPVAKDQSHPKSGLQTSTGIWFDPWGSPYHVAIDCDESGELNGKVPIPDFYSDLGSLKTGVVVWSYGKNGELGGGPAKKSGFSDEPGTPGKYSGSGDIVSW